MPSQAAPKSNVRVVSALSALSNFGKLLDRVDDERQSLVMEKRGTPRGGLLSIGDYLKLAAPEPHILRILGEESARNGTNKLGPRQVEEVIQQSRSEKQARKRAKVVRKPK